MTRPIIKLPFPGFYESDLSHGLDREEEQFLENEVEKEKYEDAVPPELRVANELGEVLWTCMDHHKAYNYLARQYVATFNHIFGDTFAKKLRLEFETVDSPHEYNFYTDRVYAFTTWAAVDAMWSLSRRDNHRTLASVIAERFTSCSGFISGYPNNLASWQAKPRREWDHNELETLLIACLEIEGTPRNKIMNEVVENMYEDFSQAFDEGLDWPKFNAKAAELRADKVREAQELDPGYVAPAERCPFTLDMFAGTHAP